MQAKATRGRFDHLLVRDSDSDSEADVGRDFALSSERYAPASAQPAAEVEAAGPTPVAKATAPPASQVGALSSKGSSAHRGNNMVSALSTERHAAATATATPRPAAASSSARTSVSDGKRRRSQRSHERQKHQRSREGDDGRSVPTAHNSLLEGTNSEVSSLQTKETRTDAQEVQVQGSRGSGNADKIAQVAPNVEGNDQYGTINEAKNKLETVPVDLPGPSSTRIEYENSSEMVGGIEPSSKPQLTSDLERFTFPNHSVTGQEVTAPELENIVTNGSEGTSPQEECDTEEMKRFLGEKYWEKTYGFDPSKRRMLLFVAEEHCPPSRSFAKLIPPKPLESVNVPSPHETLTLAPTTQEVGLGLPSLTHETKLMYSIENEARAYASVPLAEEKHIEEEKFHDRVDQEPEHEQGQNSQQYQQQEPSGNELSNPQVVLAVEDSLISNVAKIDPLKAQLSIHSNDARESSPKRSERSNCVASKKNISEVAAQLIAEKKSPSYAASSNDKKSLLGLHSIRAQLSMLDHNEETKGSVTGTRTSITSEDRRGESLSIKESLENTQESLASKDQKTEGLPHRQSLDGVQGSVHSIDRRSEGLPHKESLDSAQGSGNSRDRRSEKLPHKESLDNAQGSGNSRDRRSEKLPHKESLDSVQGSVHSIDRRSEGLPHKESLDSAQGSVHSIDRRSEGLPHKDSLDSAQGSVNSRDRRSEGLPHKESLESAQGSGNSRDRRSEKLPHRESLDSAQGSVNSRDRRSGGLPHKESLDNAQGSGNSRDRRSEGLPHKESLESAQGSGNSRDRRSARLPKRNREHKSEGGSSLMSGELANLANFAAREISVKESTPSSCHERIGSHSQVNDSSIIRDRERHSEEYKQTKNGFDRAMSNSFKSCISTKTCNFPASRQNSLADRYPSPQSKWADTPPLHHQLLYSLEEKERRKQEGLERELKESTFQPNLVHSPYRNGRLPLRHMHSAKGGLAPNAGSPGRRISPPRRAAYEEPPPTFRPTITKRAQDVRRSNAPYHERLYVVKPSALPRPPEAMEWAQELSPRILEAIAAGKAMAEANIFPHGLYTPGISPRARGIRHEDPFHMRLYPTDEELERRRTASQSPQRSPAHSSRRVVFQEQAYPDVNGDLNSYCPEISPKAMHIENALPFYERLYPEKDVQERQRARRDESPARGFRQSPSCKVSTPSPRRRPIRISPRLLERPAPPVDPNHYSFHPQISPRARAISTERTPGPFHERLFPKKGDEKQKVNGYQEFSFHPQITERAQRLNLRRLEDGTFAHFGVKGRSARDAKKPRQSENHESEIYREITPETRSENLSEQRNNKERINGSVDVH